jgi:acetyl-CoA carboxylase carboxyl transferase subunit beta
MAWFKKERTPLPPQGKRDIPEGVWVKCDGCAEIVYQKELEKNFLVCPSCRYHFQIAAERYIELLTDLHSFKEHDATLTSADPLEFTDSKRYPDRLKQATAKSGLRDAVISGMAAVDGQAVSLAVMDFRFIGGSMGSVVGEKIARAIERAIETPCPLIIISCSGGARMQEGIFSLMQLAKTSALLAQLHDEGEPFISILTHPTTAGVMASYASLGDVVIAEPRALLGFAGPRVIQQTIGQELPEGFQSSEFFLEHGYLDRIVDRAEMRRTVSLLLEYLQSARTRKLLAQAAGESALEPRPVGHKPDDA